MKLAGHTIGTPGTSLRRSMKIFSDIGYDGIEIRCAKDGQLNTESFDIKNTEKIKELATEFNLEIACISPYFRDFIHEDKRSSEIESMKKVVDIAAAIGCSKVKSFGGLEPDSKEDYNYYWDRTVSGLKVVGEYAAKKNIDICIETQGGSLTMSATDTVSMVEDIKLDNVGILFDYANLAQEEELVETVRMVAPYLKHVHVKDLIVVGDERHYTLLGMGDIKWSSVIEELFKIGYKGYLSDEYEKYWKEYMPEPQIGMKHNHDILRHLIEKYNN